jgi:hypothetical protein
MQDNKKVLGGISKSLHPMRIYDPQNKINNKGEMKNDENK